MQPLRRRARQSQAMPDTQQLQSRLSRLLSGTSETKDPRTTQAGVADGAVLLEAVDAEVDAALGEPRGQPAAPHEAKTGEAEDLGPFSAAVASYFNGQEGGSEAQASEEPQEEPPPAAPRPGWRPPGPEAKAADEGRGGPTTPGQEAAAATRVPLGPAERPKEELGTEGQRSATEGRLMSELTQLMRWFEEGKLSYAEFVTFKGALAAEWGTRWKLQS